MGAHVADVLKGTLMYELYMRVAPLPEDFPKLLDKIGVGLKTPFGLTHYNVGTSPLFAAVTLSFLDAPAQDAG